jgi:hypothetical protein
MATFDGVTFQERGAGGGQGFPLWSAEATVNVILIPGGAPVIQTGGNPPESLDMPFQCTTAQYSSLKGKKGDQGSLVIASGSYTAILAGISGVEVTASANKVHGSMRFLKVGV